MIIIKIMGGLGNQMFQYALARSIIEKGKKVKIDTTYYNNIPALDTNRKYELDLFPYSFEFATSREIKRYTSKLNYLKNIVGEYTHLYRSNIIVDREYEYNNNLVNCDNKYLVGYWQCERYFSDIRSILVDEFSFDNRALDEEDINLKNELGEDNDEPGGIKGFFKKAFSGFQIDRDDDEEGEEDDTVDAGREDDEFIISVDDKKQDDNTGTDDKLPDTEISPSVVQKPENVNLNKASLSLRELIENAKKQVEDNCEQVSRGFDIAAKNGKD